MIEFIVVGLIVVGYLAVLLFLFGKGFFSIDETKLFDDSIFNDEKNEKDQGEK